MIERVVSSVRPHVDGVFIFDTGSIDRTLEVVELLATAPGAPITLQLGEDVPVLPDGTLADFAWARNQSFAMPAPDFDWLFWCDSDDVVVGGDYLRDFASSAAPSTDGFLIAYAYGGMRLWQPRLLRRERGWKWRRPVHETCAPEGRDPALEICDPGQVHVVHQPSPFHDSPSRNIAILRREVESAPSLGEVPDPRAVLDLGCEYVGIGDLAAAEALLRSYLADPRTQVGLFRWYAAHQLAYCLRRTGGRGEAISVELAAIAEQEADFEECREQLAETLGSAIDSEVLRRATSWPGNAVGLAELYAEIGEWERCEYWARRVLEAGPPYPPDPYDPVEFCLRPRALLAMAEQHRRETRDSAGVA